MYAKCINRIKKKICDIEMKHILFVLHIHFQLHYDSKSMWFVICMVKDSCHWNRKHLAIANKNKLSGVSKYDLFAQRIELEMSTKNILLLTVETSQ